MKTPYDDLRSLFERAHELREQIRDGDTRSLCELNTTMDTKKLGGKLVVLSVPEYELHPAHVVADHSHHYPSGRLGSFAVQYGEDGRDHELVVVIDDVRGTDGSAQLAVIDDGTEAYDVAHEQADSRVFAHIKDVLVAPDFSFPVLASVCQDIGAGNLNLALFAAAINSTRLPSEVASAIYTSPCAVAYFTNGQDVGPPQYSVVRYELERRDMFSFIYRKQTKLFQTAITGMLPNAPQGNFRNILVGQNIVGHDLA